MSSKILVRMLLCSLLFITATGGAFASTKMLMLNPVRAIFTDRQRSVKVNVSNPTGEPITYTVSLVTMRKDQRGKLYTVEKEAETEGEKLVKSMIRFSPRRTTIATGQRQVVRLMTRKPKELPPGEYQTRLRFTPLRLGKNNLDVQMGTGDLSETAVDLDLIVASTIPLIIQHGGLESDISPKSISLKKSPKYPAELAADVVFSRSGDCSAFGNVFLKYIPVDDPKAIREIGRSQGLAIYLPDTEKTLTVLLKEISPQELTSGTIQVEFRPHLGVVNKRRRSAKPRIKKFVLQ